MVLSGRGGLSFLTVAVFAFGGCVVAEFGVQPFGVEPGDPGAGREFQVVESFSGAAVAASVAGLRFSSVLNSPIELSASALS